MVADHPELGRLTKACVVAKGTMTLLNRSSAPLTWLGVHGGTLIRAGVQ